MLIPVAFQIGAPCGRFSCGQAWAAAPRVAGIMAAVPNLAKLRSISDGAAPPIMDFAAPFAFPALTMPALGFAVPPALTAYARVLLFWPAAVGAALAAWLVRLCRPRWSRITVQNGEPATNFTEFWPEPVPLAAIAVTIPAALERVQPPGADLAARARFVAMTFSFPEPRLARDGPASWPLHLDCRPTRFTLTLRHAALGYRLEFCNRGAQALGPLIVRADLVAGEHRVVPGREPGFAAEALPLCHYLDRLPAGDTIELTGELRLPLAGIAAVRLGAAELLVPLMRICVESAGAARPPLSVSACFAIGLPPLAAGGGIQPFRLDTGPAIWRKPTARRLMLADLS